jgi:hypothetical protein
MVHQKAEPLKPGRPQRNSWRFSLKNQKQQNFHAHGCAVRGMDHCAEIRCQLLRISRIAGTLQGGAALFRSTLISAGISWRLSAVFRPAFQRRPLLVRFSCSF